MVLRLNLSIKSAVHRRYDLCVVDLHIFRDILDVLVELAFED